MEKRVFLAIFLSFLVLVIYETQFAPKPPPVTPAVQTATPAASPGATPTAVPTPVTGAAAAQTAPMPPPGAPAAAPVIPDVNARDVVVETDSVIAVFSTQGAVLKSYRLRRYADARGESLELVPGNLPASASQRPFVISTDNDAESALLAAAVYQPSADRLTLGSDAGRLSFEYHDASGLNVRKTFTFQQNAQPYVVHLEASVDVGGAPRPMTIGFGPAIGLGYNPDGASVTLSRAIHFIDGDER